jgi:hypothetical protein
MNLRKKYGIVRKTPICKEEEEPVKLNYEDQQITKSIVRNN